MILEKPKRERDSDYLAYIREQPCLAGNRCTDKESVDAHHVIAKGQGKVGSKVDDRMTVPLCRHHHDLYHRIGMDEFEARFAVILNYEIAKLNREYRAPKKAKREKPVGIVSIDVRCRCAQKTHHFPPSKVIHTETGLYWQCPVLHEMVIVE